MESKNKEVEHLFRNEYGKLMALLSQKFGVSQLEHIEDVLQDTFLKAMKVWSYGSIPNSPTAWLYRVSNNRLIDVLRRSQRTDYLVQNDLGLLNSQTENDDLFLDNTIVDSQLRMIFACCHPSLSQEYQIVLSLKLIGGFNNAEIANALLKKEETIAKAFTRAKRKLKNEINLNISPVQMGLQTRLFVVLRVLYLIFSEGYSATSGATVIKRDFCYEALRLALLLKDNKYCGHPNLEALIALMCFHASRFDARLDKNGQLVDLENQERTKYSQELIQIGICHLKRSKTKDNKPSHYHLEAARSYYHCIAENFEETDWSSILKLYDIQLKNQSTALIELNRVVAYYKVHGARKGLKELSLRENRFDFKTIGLYYAIKAELLLNTNEKIRSKTALESAIRLSENELEKTHLEKKLNKILTEL